ncbi:MAG: hypothetical protein ACE5E9_04815 [Nitrospinaceae bacterium]
MRIWRKGVLASFPTGFLLLLVIAWGLPVQKAEGLSQFARKYKVDCTTCHTAFPRLNYFGELFFRNGFQWPGEPPDGDTVGKEEISENLVIDQVGNWFGARVGLTPLEYKTNARTRNSILEDTFDVGNADFFALFLAGSLFKNVSIFVEAEFKTDEFETEFAHVIFTNLYDTFVNFQVGLINPSEFSSYSDGKRIWQKSDILNVKSSGGGGENSTNVRSSRPGILYYGYKGPFVWFGGVDNGKDATDTDNDKNLWGGLRLEVPNTVKSPFVGSSISYMYYQGQDTSGGLGTAGTPALQQQNDFFRHTIAANIRFKTNLELMGVYQFGRDDNFKIATLPGPTKAEFHGYTLAGAYKRDDWYYVLQYDEINSDDVASLDLTKVSPSIWYYLRDNFKMGFAMRFDVRGNDPVKNEYTVVIRTMF